MATVLSRLRGVAKRAFNFDAGKSARRLRAVPRDNASINTLIRRYGATVLARSRYLAANNPYAAAAKEEFRSALVGSGIKPSSLVTEQGLRESINLLWRDWTDEADADGLTDFYGMQAIVADEMFEAGECFVRLRPRRLTDGLSVPLQLQIMPAEMLDLAFNQAMPGRNRIECGIEFDAIGRRVAYHFWRQHPGQDATVFTFDRGQRTRVPADEVLHLFRPMRAGQVRGVPHTLSAIVKLAILDAYDDAELERKRVAALFAAFVMRPGDQDATGPLGAPDEETAGTDAAIPMMPGAVVHLLAGEDIKFAEPADVGGNYEAFQYRTLLAVAAGFGVPYANMTGDLRQASYGSQRAGIVAFRRRIEAMQHSVMVFQFCRPIWQRWLTDAATLTQELGVSPAEIVDPKALRDLQRAKWMSPAFAWIDPLKDIQAEALAVENGFKSRSDVIEGSGSDPEETDQRIAADKEREEELGLKFGAQPPAPPGDPNNPDDPDAPPKEDGEEDEDDGEAPPKKKGPPDDDAA